MREIKALLRDPDTQVADVAQRYGMSRTQVYKHGEVIKPKDIFEAHHWRKSLAQIKRTEKPITLNPYKVSAMREPSLFSCLLSMAELLREGAGPR